MEVVSIPTDRTTFIRNALMFCKPNPESNGGLAAPVVAAGWALNCFFLEPEAVSFGELLPLEGDDVP